MVEATVVMRNGYGFYITATDLKELYGKIEPLEGDIAAISARVIRISDLRQGKETAFH